MGKVYDAKNTYAKAQSLFDKVFEIGQETGDEQGTAAALHQTGMIYEEKAIMMPPWSYSKNHWRY